MCNSRGWRAKSVTKIKFSVKRSEQKKQGQSFLTLQRQIWCVWHLMHSDFFSPGQVFSPVSSSTFKLLQLMWANAADGDQWPSVLRSVQRPCSDRLAGYPGCSSKASQRPTTLSEQQTRKLSSHQEAKLGSAAEYFLTFQTFLCTSRWEPSPSLSHPIRRLITSLSCSLERGCDQRPKERKKERRRRRKKQALILFQMTFLITAKKNRVLQGNGVKTPRSETKEELCCS